MVMALLKRQWRVKSDPWQNAGKIQRQGVLPETRASQPEGVRLADLGFLPEKNRGPQKRRCATRLGLMADGVGATAKRGTTTTCPRVAHSPVSFIGTIEHRDEEEQCRRSAAHLDRPGRPHFPVSVIGGSGHRDEGGPCRRPASGQDIYRAAHTSPCRLSAVSGEKVNQVADFENHKSQISNRPSTKAVTGGI
jgi:hypothetical protein